MIRLSLRGLVARPLRTALTTLAIVLGVALVTGALTLTDTQRRAADALSSASYDGTDAVVSAKTAFTIGTNDWAAQKPTVAASELAAVRGVPGVTAAIGDITDQNAKIIGKDGKPLGDGPYFGVGLDARTPGFEQLTPFRLQDGRWAAGGGEVVIDALTAEDEGYAIGDRVRVSTRGEASAFTVVGIAKFGEVKSLGPATAAIFDVRTAQTLFRKGDAYDSILVAGDDGVRAALARELPGSVQVQTAAKHDRFTFDGLEQFISIIRIVLLVFGGVAILVGALTIVNSLSITVAQRTKELGLLRLVGASRRQVLGSVLGEALAIGLLGSVAGIAAGYGIALALQALFASMGLDLPDAGTVFLARTAIVALLVGTLVTLAAGLVPALRATRVAPVTALRDAEPGAKRTGLVARVVRPVVSLLGRPAQRLGGVAGGLARRNAMRQPGRTAATASALMVGVALVTLVAVMAQGLRDTTTGSLERRVAATHVVVDQDGWSPTSDDVARAVAGTPGVRTVGTIRQDVGLVFGDKERVNAFDAGAERLVRFDWASGSAPTALGRDGAIVDDGWAAEHGLALGERFSVLSPSGERVALTVKGIETSPVLDGLDQGPITVSRAAFDGAFAAERNLYTLVDAPGAGAAVERALAPFPETRVQTRQAFVDERLSDIDALMGLFAVLLALAVIVSLFGIVNALVLATFERRRELGMLSAIGMTRRQVRRMVRHESIVTALLGAAGGIGVGLALGYAATSALSDEGLGFAVPTGQLIVLALAAVICGVLAAVLPARRAARLSPLAALQYE